jgi:uncharacterized membrane protein YidH (DUF202 family)
VPDSPVFQATPAGYLQAARPEARSPDSERRDKPEERNPMYIGIGTIVVIVIIVLLVLMLRRRA